ncbi:hypothetical protein Tco_0984463 [Tanacetum coccineum]
MKNKSKTRIDNEGLYGKRRLQSVWLFWEINIFGGKQIIKDPLSEKRNHLLFITTMLVAMDGGIAIWKALTTKQLVLMKCGSATMGGLDWH